MDPDPIANIAAERQDAHRVACRLDVLQDSPRRRIGIGWVAPPADNGQNVLTLHRVAHLVVRAHTQLPVGKDVLEHSGGVRVMGQQALGSPEGVGEGALAPAW